METPNTESDTAPKVGVLPTVLNVLGLLCGVWFLFFGINWAWAIALILGYPVAVVGWILWFAARKLNPASKFNRVVMWVLILGLVASVGTLVFTK